jgi:phosphonate transport system substrate-binding protein
MKKVLHLILVLFLASCGQPSVATVIDLSNLQPLPPAPISTIEPLRVSVAAVLSPQGTADSYRPLLEYLSRRLERPVELVQRQTYAETNLLVEQGLVDLAFVCTSAYVAGHDAFGMELLAAPLVNHETVYYSVLIVPTESRADSMEDLRGGVFAFTDPISYTGRVYPTYLIEELGSSPEQFFERTFFTYSHDDAIEAVTAGIADGASVDSIVYDFAVARDPSLAQKVRIIDRSPPFGIPPVVVSPNIRPQLRSLLQEALFNLSSDPVGQDALNALGFEGFVEIDDGSYDSVRQVADAVGTLTP